MDAQNDGKVLSAIFGSHTQGLSLFSNNAFRRQSSAIPEGAHVDLRTAMKGSVGSARGEGAAAPLWKEEREQVGVSKAEKETASGRKPKKKSRVLEHTSSDPLSSPKEFTRTENQGKSRSAKASKARTPERTLEKLDTSFVSDTILVRKAEGLHAAQETIFKTKSKEQEDFVKAAHTQSRGVQREWRPECEDGKHRIGSAAIRSEKREKRGKRVFGEVSEPHEPMKRQKTSSDDASLQTLFHRSLLSKSSGPVHSGGSPKKANEGIKRKKENALEARYEKKLRGLDDTVSAREESQPTSATKDGKISNEGRSAQIRMGQTNYEGASAQIKKRKRVEVDEHDTEALIPRTFDGEEKLQRTIFVGNLPLAVKKKYIIKEFSTYGPVESVRLRSVPLLDTKVPRKGAIITGQINKAVDSQHAYVVFKTSSDANAALAHNMKEFFGNHVRVDAAYVPHGLAGKGKPSPHYDHERSLFVGNVPFDVKDEELYQTFAVGNSLELDVEAVRVVRDSQTSLSKGIAYVLFKTKAGASFFFSPKREVKLRDRILRISRVLASQSMQKQILPSPSKRVRKPEETSNSQRKRAKLSTFYEGVRARKEPNKARRKGLSSRGGQQHVGGSSVKERAKGLANIAGTKRKRAEQKQRGISRSKKIRRT